MEIKIEILNNILEDDISQILQLQKDHNQNIITENIIKNSVFVDNVLNIVAKDGNLIIAFMQVTLNIDIMDIDSIIVSKKYTRQRIATKMINYSCEVAKEKNIKNIMLEVRKSNTAAQKLYTSLDFEHIHTRKNYYTNPVEDAFIYKKIILN